MEDSLAKILHLEETLVVPFNSLDSEVPSNLLVDIGIQLVADPE